MGLTAGFERFAASKESKRLPVPACLSPTLIPKTFLKSQAGSAVCQHVQHIAASRLQGSLNSHLLHSSFTLAGHRCCADSCSLRLLPVISSVQQQL